MVLLLLYNLFLSFILVPSVNGKIITDPAIVAGKTYDFVVIGGRLLTFLLLTEY
jgi:hypothetical protein